MREIYFKTDHVCLWFDEVLALGGGIWQGIIPSDQYRVAFQKSYQLVAERKLSKWIGDNRKMTAMSLKDQEWTFSQANIVISSGLKKMATIVSEDILHHMAIINLFDRASGLLTFQNHYFKNEKEALIWLEMVEQPSKETISF